MKKLILPLLFIVGCLGFQSCSDTVSYEDMLNNQDDAIEAFIKEHNIEVISQRQFLDQDSVTDLTRNQYVLLASGVYMQLVDEGDKADTLRTNDEVLVRFLEYSIIDKDTTLNNINNPEIVDEFRYTNSNGSITGLFISGYMATSYGSSVLSGWLAPLPYIGNNAHVKLIVPADMGHQTASRYVYPYFYDLRKIQMVR